MFLPQETFRRKPGVIDEMAHKHKLLPQQEHHFHSIPALYQGFRRKKCNCITLTERQEARRANAHSFCVLIEIILCVKIMPSKTSNNLSNKVLLCHKKTLQHKDTTVTNLELIYHCNKSD